MAAPSPLDEPVTRATRPSSGPGPINDSTSTPSSTPFTSHLDGHQVAPGHSSARGSRASVSVAWSSSGLFSFLRCFHAVLHSMRVMRPLDDADETTGCTSREHVRLPTNRAGPAGMRSGAGASRRRRGRQPLRGRRRSGSRRRRRRAATADAAGPPTCFESAKTTVPGRSTNDLCPDPTADRASYHTVRVRAPRGPQLGDCGFLGFEPIAHLPTVLACPLGSHRKWSNEATRPTRARTEPIAFWPRARR
jgi:hypothetical protein